MNVLDVDQRETNATQKNIMTAQTRKKLTTSTRRAACNLDALSIVEVEVATSKGEPRTPDWSSRDGKNVGSRL